MPLLPSNVVKMPTFDAGIDMLLVVKVIGTLFQSVKNRRHLAGTSAKAKDILGVQVVQVLNNLVFRHGLDFAVLVDSVDFLIPDSAKALGQVVGQAKALGKVDLRVCAKIAVDEFPDIQGRGVVDFLCHIPYRNNLHGGVFFLYYII